MLDALVTAITLDQILLGLVGQVANDATAKLSLAAVKALGPAVFGLLRTPGEIPTAAKPGTAKRRKKRQKVRAAACRCLRHGGRVSRGGRK